MAREKAVGRGSGVPVVETRVILSLAKAKSVMRSGAVMEEWEKLEQLLATLV